jgi:hypothetical protein
MSIYAITSALNIIIPFKLGELVRFFIIGHYLKDFKITFLSIMTERLLDSILILVVLFISWLQYGFVYPIMIGMTAFVIVGITMYIVIPEINTSLKRYLILKKGTFFDAKFLKILDTTNKLYEKELIIIHEKIYQISFLTIVAWICDIGAVVLICLKDNLSCGIKEVSEFINNITSPKMFNTNNMYLTISLSILFMIFIVSKLLLKPLVREFYE